MARPISRVLNTLLHSHKADHVLDQPCRSVSVLLRKIILPQPEMAYKGIVILWIQNLPAKVGTKTTLFICPEKLPFN